MQLTVVMKIVGRGFVDKFVLNYGESGDEQDTGDAGSKDGQEGTDLTVEGTGEAVEATDETVEPTDQAVELRKDLKQLCRITKLQQKQLEKWTTNVNKSLVAEVKSTYKNYVQYCGDIDAKFKKLLGIKEVTKTEVL